MSTAQEVERNLMNYFAAVDGQGKHSFSVRDFHSQVMMNAYTEMDRSFLQVALSSLIDGGVIALTTRNEYHLTKEGQRRVQAMRESRRPAGAANAARAPGKRPLSWT